MFILLRIMLYKFIILNYHYVILHVYFQKKVFAFIFRHILLVYRFSVLHYYHNKVSNLL